MQALVSSVEVVIFVSQLYLYIQIYVSPHHASVPCDIFYHRPVVPMLGSFIKQSTNCISIVGASNF